MNYLGVYLDREYNPVPGWTLPTYQALAAQGLKFDIETQINADNTSGKINLAEDVSYFKQITPNAVSSSVPWYEGPNEFT